MGEVEVEVKKQYGLVFNSIVIDMVNLGENITPSMYALLQLGV